MQWMQRHLPQTQLMEAAEKKAAAAADRRRRLSAPTSLFLLFSRGLMEVDTSIPTWPAIDPSAYFDKANAVWLRQTLSRWRFISSCEDTDGCLISRQYTKNAYQSILQLSSMNRWTAGDPWMRVIDLAGHILMVRGHAHHLAVPCGGDNWSLRVQGAVAERAQRRAAERWERSTTARPLFALLPHAVLVHSVLPFFDGEVLLLRRAVNRHFRLLAEQAACAWMNRRFPNGLRTMARQREEERQQAAKPRDRFRERTGAQVGSAVALRTPSRKGPSSPSTSTFSSHSSAHPSTDLPSLSYTVADVMWLAEQMAWARHVFLSGGRAWTAAFCADLPLICQSEGVDRFPVSSSQWGEHFGTGSSRSAAFTPRWSIVSVIDLLLSIHGNVAKLREGRRQRTDPRRLRIQGGMAAAALSSRRREEAFDEVTDQLDGEGLKAKFHLPPHSSGGSFDCEGIRILFNDSDEEMAYLWLRYDGTQRTRHIDDRSSLPSCQHLNPSQKQSQLEGQALLHRVMIHSGMRCYRATSGRGCGWGGC